MFEILTRTRVRARVRARTRARVRARARADAMVFLDGDMPSHVGGKNLSKISKGEMFEECQNSMS